MFLLASGQKCAIISLVVTANSQSLQILLLFKKVLKKVFANDDLICYNDQALKQWRLSSVGRASALQAEGQRFEPVSLHHLADLAQLVEQLTCNQ